MDDIDPGRWDLGPGPLPPQPLYTYEYFLILFYVFCFGIVLYGMFSIFFKHKRKKSIFLILIPLALSLLVYNICLQLGITGFPALERIIYTFSGKY